jgi:GTP-binding protein Era
MNNIVKKCGFVAIVGRPNVGKSTLMNHILKQKISITSSKPQTTRHRILGIKTENNVQTIYVDTPGLHLKAKKAMNRYMNKAADSILQDVDLILFVVEAGKWTDEDENVVAKLSTVSVPVILVVNKVDKLKRKDQLLPFIEEVSKHMSFRDVVPLSAKSGDNVDAVEQIVETCLPEGTAMFPEEQITDKGQRFLAAEMIREKLMRRLRQDLPYALTVEIENFTDEKNMIRIDAVIWVERDSQKGIVIGKSGEILKEVGTQARRDMERLFEKKVHLNLWAKVKKGWADDERMLKSFGYTDDF